MKLIKPTEVAKRMRVTVATVRRWVHVGTLPVLKISARKWLFDEAAVEALLREKNKTAKS